MHGFRQRLYALHIHRVRNKWVQLSCQLVTKNISDLFYNDLHRHFSLNFSQSCSWKLMI